MTTARIASIAAIAAFASLGAQAGQLNGNLYGTDFEAGFNASRTRAEVQAEASTVSSTRNFHPAGSDVLPPMASTVDRSTVHAQAVERARSGDAHRGEATMM